MLEFKYALPEKILSLMGVFDNFHASHLDGYVDEADLHRLSQVSLYIVCEAEEIKNSTKKKYKNPIGIIGRNDGDVLEKYSSIKNKEGFVFAELVHNCSELKVEPK